MAYHDCLPLSRPCPPRIVPPRHALAARAQVAQPGAEQQHAAEDAQDIEDGEARGGFGGLFFNGGFEVGFFLLADGVGGWCRCGLAVPRWCGHCVWCGVWCGVVCGVVVGSLECRVPVSKKHGFVITSSTMLLSLVLVACVNPQKRLRAFGAQPQDLRTWL